MVLCTRPPELCQVDSCAYPGHTDVPCLQKARQRQLGYSQDNQKILYDTNWSGSWAEQRACEGCWRRSWPDWEPISLQEVDDSWTWAGTTSDTVWGAVAWYIGRQKLALSWRGCINPEDVSRASRWPCSGHRWDGQPIPSMTAPSFLHVTHRMSTTILWSTQSAQWRQWARHNMTAIYQKSVITNLTKSIHEPNKKNSLPVFRSPSLKTKDKHAGSCFLS